jgi:hypothetical protein
MEEVPVAEDGEDPRHGRSEDGHGQEHHNDHLGEVPPERAPRPMVGRSIGYHINAHDPRLPRRCMEPDFGIAPVLYTLISVEPAR